MMSIHKPLQPSLDRAGWTFLILLVVAVTASLAEAQTSGGGETAIDKLKCSDIQGSERLLKEQIVKQIREAQSNGFKPALGYEGAGEDLGSLQSRVESRAAKQASELSRALFASVNQPSAPGDAASQVLNGDPKRRSAMAVAVRCSGQDRTPRTVIENHQYFTEINRPCNGGSTPQDFGMNVTQVFQTDLQPAQVRDRFARVTLRSSNDNKMTVCTLDGAEGRTGCRNPQNYSEVDVPDFSPKPNREYYLRSEKKMCGEVPILGYQCSPTPMDNRVTFKVSPVDICGARAYLITGFANGHNAGFDRSSLIGLIAPVGGKTLVLGDFSAQSWTAGSWPLELPKHTQSAMDAVFGELDRRNHQMKRGYIDIAEMIGSRERPIMGQIGGTPDALPASVARMTSSVR